MSSVLPTHDLSFAGYPQREIDRGWPALRAALRWLQAAVHRPQAAARLPEAVARGLARAAPHWAQADPAELQRALPELRGRLRHAGLEGETAGEALAYVAEQARRTLGLAPYPTQLLAAWLMLDGQLAEMATGEGKTLAAGLAAAAAALAGVPVHLLTANDYLVQRDREKMAPLYGALGLTSACVLPALSRPERAVAYRHDIVVVSARELAFDYLRDHLLLRGVRDPRLLRALSLDAVIEASIGPSGAGPSASPVLPGLCLALIDEADSILLDEATVPLILAAPADPVELLSYRRAMDMARRLQRGRDYRLHAARRQCELTDEGRAAVDSGVAAFSADPGLLRPRRRAHELVAAALSARHAMRRDRDYAVAGGKLQLIDEVTGRIADGRQWTGPLQAMVELKEGLEPSPATRVSAQITYQRFFPRYLRLGGMSGTLTEARRELLMSYGVRVQRVPLARPDRRRWLGERLFARGEQRDAALVERVREMVQLGRPVLVGTDSVAASVRVDLMLKVAGLQPQVLNAVQDAHEAECVARAGQAGVITVATNMAGRGTDIALDEAARAAGGLHVIATMRNRSRRIDRQLIGRAARHGDPGSAERLLAFDDALFVEQAPAIARRLVSRIANGLTRHGVVPRAAATLFAAFVQRRAEWQAAGVRTQLRRSEQRDDETFAFAGGTE